MRNLLGLLVVLLVGCPSTPPVVPTPDASDAAPAPGDSGAYVACCAAMGDRAAECPATLQHVVESKLTTNATACSKCGLACP